MKSIVFATVACALVALVGAVNHPDFDADWKLFKFTHQKQYPTMQREQMRRAIWESNIARINKHNLRFQLGQESYEVGINHFGDLTTAEIESAMNGVKSRQANAAVSRELFVATPGFEANTTTVDWRTKGIVTPVKEQRDCGSGWAFSATGSLEGQHALKTKKLVSLSEQELVDCSANNGCRGGLLDLAFDYILENKGIDTEEAYPYTGQNGDEYCKPNKNAIGATITGYVDIKSKDENDLTKAIAEKGPISVGIDGSGFGFRFYKSGIYYNQVCDEDQWNHGVLAVGYGDKGGANGKYYIVKNSWNVTWGDKGYVLMSRQRDNNCGIATRACYPKV